MRPLDWFVLVGTLLAIVLYGLWRARRSRTLDAYLLSNREKRWWTVALSIMATQASAITFLSTPGQAFTDGMRFVQFYFGLPIAMVVLAVTVVPIYHRLKVYTAYEYLEGRFDLKTRGLAAFLFLLQRGLACGLTIYAPAVIISIIFGWNISWMILIIGVLVIAYTASGGSRAVDYTNFQQMLVIMFGMTVAFIVIIMRLPADVSFGEAVWVAGQQGRLNAIDFSFDPRNRYNIWSGLIGGFFLALAYFGTDQSQVGRYLGGKSIAQSRMGLIFNGLVKVPMQFYILFIGAMVFVFYQFVTPPIHFNTVATTQLAGSQYAGEFAELQSAHEAVSERKQATVRHLLETRGTPAEEPALAALRSVDGELHDIRNRTMTLMREVDPKAATNDTNFVFLNFVLNYLPVGLVGLVLAAILSASMSSTASELNALASTSVIDIYKRVIKKDGSDRHYLIFSRIATLFWGAVAITFAEFAGQLGSLVEAVNQIGSLFYGTMLGIFLLAFYFKRVSGTPAFIGALIGEAAVIITWRTTEVAFLWYNVIGCLVAIGAALLLSPLFPRKPEAPAAAGAPV
jgi:solute:Na+ symporter, SSS family